MSYRTYSAKDGNHDALVAIFRRMGCTVLETIRTGIAGMPDLMVGVSRQWHAVEIKNPETRYGKKGLNANQTAFDRDSNGEPVYVVSTEDGVVALVNEWRRPAIQPFKMVGGGRVDSIARCRACLGELSWVQYGNGSGHTVCLKCTPPEAA